MENNASSVIIKVKDINICRSFYRNVLNMGNPIVNSNFRVEFMMAKHAILVLLQEREALEIIETIAPPVIILNENIDEICARLDEIECHYDFINNGTKDKYSMRDPEGRIILFTSCIPATEPIKSKRCNTAHQRNKKNISSPTPLQKIKVTTDL